MQCERSFVPLKVSMSHLVPSVDRNAVLFLFNTEPISWPPLWSSGQRFWLQVHRSRIRFPALPDFLRSRGSGSGSSQPCEDN
jgi:hypothetical protein